MKTFDVFVPMLDGKMIVNATGSSPSDAEENLWNLHPTSDEQAARVEYVPATLTLKEADRDAS